MPPSKKTKEPTVPVRITNEDLTEQLQTQRRTVDFDTYDVLIQQILSMLQTKSIDIAPAYQRRFRWGDDRCSQLIESFLLGIPVPSLFMATNRDSTWELVDGVQRLSALVKFAGSEQLRARLGISGPLQLIELEKLTVFNGKKFADLPQSVQLQFELRPIKVVTLSDKSDEIVRFDLFERLNTGGVSLTPQEIRNCVFRGKFSDFLEEMGQDKNFKKVVRLKESQDQDGTREEGVLRFFAYLNRYQSFVHSVKDFLNDYMRDSSKQFDYHPQTAVFRETFLQLSEIFPNGIARLKSRKTTPLNLFEGVAVGAALALQKKKKLHQNGLSWLGSDELTSYTIGATNNLKSVRGRIEFCRDKFLGK